jgi:SAM-dependent methyltransferase
MPDGFAHNAPPQLEPTLAQKGRASFDFLAALGMGAQRLLAPQVGQDMVQNGVTNEALPDELDARIAFVEAAMANSNAFRVQQVLGEFHGRNSGPMAAQAFLEVRDDLREALDLYASSGPVHLEANPDLVPPTYWQGVDFHRTTGGWDAYPDAGYVHGELIHKMLVEKLFPGGIFKQRRQVAGLAPRRDYKAILEMGCSTGHYTTALSETFPEAQITGVEVSLSTLEHARRVGNSKGYAWKLYQRAAEDTGLPSESFDFVTSYILLHEMPETAVRAVFAEAYRVAKPGADMLMSDVTRYSALDKIGVFRADYGAKYGGEPHWRESASLDLALIASEAGFVDVVSQGVGGAPYPWIVSGRKPI